MRWLGWLLVIVPWALVSVLSGCSASSHVIVGTLRLAIEPSQVKLYLTPPSQYEAIAMVDASSKYVAAWSSDQTKADKVIERLKAEAAALGANGLLLHGVGEQSAGAIGIGTATATGGRGYAMGMGFGMSSAMFMKSGQALAIFVTQE